MAPAAPIRSATTAAASKRPPASDAHDQLVDYHQISHGAAATTEGDDAAAVHRGQQPKQQQQQQLECPRCQSTNTKFCYYNNYSTAQPRHFCRACRRYWTHSGTLRDVPVGGASRRPSAKRRRLSAAAKSEQPSSSSASASASPPASAGVVDAASAYLPDLSSAFPFLSDGSFVLPQFDLGAAAPAAAFSSWPHSVVPDFYDGLAPWDDGTVGAAAGVTGAWGDIAGLELSWPPPLN